MRKFAVALTLIVTLSSLAHTYYKISDPGEGMTTAAEAFLATLTPNSQACSSLLTASFLQRD